MIAGWSANRPGRPGPELVVREARTGKERYAVPFKAVRSCTLSADGKLLAAADEEGKVQVHDLEAKKELFTFSNPGGVDAGSMRISADRKVIYLCAPTGNLHRWDLVNNRRLPDVGRLTDGDVPCIALDSDESTLYSGGTDGLVRRWDLKAGKKMADPDGYVTKTTMALHPDGKHMFVADRAGRIDKWEIATGRHIKRLQESGKEAITCLSVSTDGRWLACGRHDARDRDLGSDRRKDGSGDSSEGPVAPRRTRRARVVQHRRHEVIRGRGQRGCHRHSTSRPGRSSGTGRKTATTWPSIPAGGGW